jgi:hypothetical protein
MVPGEGGRWENVKVWKNPRGCMMDDFDIYIYVD